MTPIIHKTGPTTYILDIRFVQLCSEVFEYLRTKGYLREYETDVGKTRYVCVEHDVAHGSYYRYLFTFSDIRDTMVFEMGFGQYIKQDYDNYG